VEIFNHWRHCIPVAVSDWIRERKKLLEKMSWLLKLKILLSIFRRISDTKGTAGPVSLRSYIIQYVLGFNKSAWWPVHHSSVISGASYIKTGTGTAPGLSHGCYIFASEDSPVSIGNYTIIAPNAGIAGYNHNLYDYRKYEKGGSLIIGDYCWIGMNAVILPGTHLGDHTVVAAGSVVTESFPEGYCIIGGNPARLLKKIDPAQCEVYRNNKEYTGYLSNEEYHKYESKLTRNRK
jgi:acetyltransferase-like isoleucine patch superfamily enzyme